MTTKKLQIACIGECMIELNEAAEQAGLLRRSFGGDTLNTAVYAARCLTDAASVAYVTALGDDPFSDELIAAWQAEGLNTDLVARLAGKLPGLYAIRTDAQGERSFYYWREQAAARELFRSAQTESILAALTNYDYVYFSGITLAILDDASRKRLLDLLTVVRANGGKIGFDSNYRPRLWPDQATARMWIERAVAHADMAFPTFDDEAILCGDRDPAATTERLRNLGAAEVIVKNGSEPCLIVTAAQQVSCPVETVATPLDTTAAGDAFNAAYFSARLLGKKPEDAARSGHRLAAKVICQRGAIIAATP